MNYIFKRHYPAFFDFEDEIFEIESPENVLELDFLVKRKNYSDFHQFSQKIETLTDDEHSYTVYLGEHHLPLRDVRKRATLFFEIKGGFKWFVMGFLYSRDPEVQPKFDLSLWKAKYKEKE